MGKPGKQAKQAQTEDADSTLENLHPLMRSCQMGQVYYHDSPTFTAEKCAAMDQFMYECVSPGCIPVIPKWDGAPDPQ